MHSTTTHDAQLIAQRSSANIGLLKFAASPFSSKSHFAPSTETTGYYIDDGIPISARQNLLIALCFTPGLEASRQAVRVVVDRPRGQNSAATSNWLRRTT